MKIIKKKKQSRLNQQPKNKNADLASLLMCYQSFVSMFMIKQVQLCEPIFVYTGNMYALCMKSNPQHH